MTQQICGACGKPLPEQDKRLHREIDSLMLQRIRASHPEWQDDDGVCAPCFGELRRLANDVDNVKNL